MGNGMQREKMKRATRPVHDVEASTGNVFADLEVPDADAALAKAELARRSCATLAARKLTQTQAAAVLGIGTASLIGSRPTASELMTTAGRTLRISAPTVGSKLTFHTSPRLGVELGIVDKVASLPFGATLDFDWRFIMLGQLRCLLGHLSSAFLQGQLQESPPLLQRQTLFGIHNA